MNGETMSGAEVLAFFGDAIKVHADAVRGSTADSLGGVSVGAVQAALSRIAGRLKDAERARATVAALIGREAALAARNAELEANAARYLWLRNDAQWCEAGAPQVVCWKRDGHRQSVCSEDELDDAIDDARAESNPAGGAA